MVGEDLIGRQQGGVRQNRIRPVPGIIAVIRLETSIEDLVTVFECARPGHLMIRKLVRWREWIIPYRAPTDRNNLVTQKSSGTSHHRCSQLTAEEIRKRRDDRRAVGAVHNVSFAFRLLVDKCQKGRAQKPGSGAHCLGVLARSMRNVIREP